MSAKNTQKHEGVSGKKLPSFKKLARNAMDRSLLSAGVIPDTLWIIPIEVVVSENRGINQ